jgi:hypothetical protein
MTEEEADALGARLAACPRFKPMPGLRDMQGRTWEQSLLWRWSPTVDRPDIREPATKGIVLALVREAWRCPTAYVRQRGIIHKDEGTAPAWEVGDLWLDAEACKKIGARVPGSVNFALLPSEEEALVSALENAP